MSDGKTPDKSQEAEKRNKFILVFSAFVVSVLFVHMVTEWQFGGISQYPPWVRGALETVLMSVVMVLFGYLFFYRMFIAGVVREGRKKEDELQRLSAAFEENNAERAAIVSVSSEIHSMLESSADGIMRVDANGVIQIANRSAHRLLGYVGLELIGKHVSTIIPNDHLKLLVAGYSSFLGGWEGENRNESVTASGLKKTGEYADFELSVSECIVSSGIQYVVTMRDVSERKKAETAVRLAKEQAEEATKLKDKFVSLVAHDLKSPLSSMLGFLKLIEEDADKPIGKHGLMVLNRVIDSGRTMTKLIDDLLNMSRLKSGQLKLEKQFFDANQIAAKICAEYSHPAEKKGIRLVNEIPGNSRIFADKTLLAEALQNLVTNAIKFCGDGSEVRISLVENESTLIRVSDNGPGISAGKIEKIFKYEENTATIDTGGETGTGLGLPLAKDIMLWHGGDLEAKCEVGKGSEFTLKLPRVRPVILVVEDDQNFRHLIGHYLKKVDAVVMEADDGAKAVDILAEAKSMPHLIISDIEMPKMTGLDLLTYLQKRNETKSIPVIIISGKHGMEIRDTVYELGAKDFLTKQIIVEDFIPRVRRYVG
jgi:PAS domain S-box-containing protein